MKNQIIHKLNIFSVFLLILLLQSPVFADNSKEAGEYVKKAQSVKNVEAKYDYLHRAEKLYLEDYENNPIDEKTLVNLSLVYQKLSDRQNAKIYILKAYNIHPESAGLQKQMGDFHFSFGEYSTAIEYYKLALINGMLKDYDTNLKTAKCYEKLGDKENYELYYKICRHLKPGSREIKNKLNEIESSYRKESPEEKHTPKYKFLYNENSTKEERDEKFLDSIINELNN